MDLPAPAGPCAVSLHCIVREDVLAHHDQGAELAHGCGGCASASANGDMSRLDACRGFFCRAGRRAVKPTVGQAVDWPAPRRAVKWRATGCDAGRSACPRRRTVVHVFSAIGA